ncbi:MAG: ammonia-forming cytochrome c nitrite reductase subunit c552 [bacterium]
MRWLLLVAAVAAGAGLWAARDEERVLFPTPRYVGEGACQRCHPAAYAAWEKSVHAKNMAIPTPETVIGDFGDVEYRFQGTRSRMFRRDGAWLMAYTDVKGRTETLRVDRTLGIKRHQAYLHARPDGRLQVLPTYWNQEERAWRDAVEGPVPGDAPLPTTHVAYWNNYGRTFNLACLDCHASQPRKGYDPATNQYASTFEPAIGCEACHGPASEHVARWDRLERDAPETLAKTGLADLDESIERCAACHAAKRIYAEGFDPGDSFYDWFIPDVWQVRERYYVDGRSSTLNYRYVDYMQNGCFRRTTRTMDCGFCHPPHGLESTADRTVQAGNALCTQCHLEHKTALVAHTHHRPESEGSRCVACHMPPMDLDLRMTVRDHTINSPLPELTRQYGVPNACAHCHADQPVAWAEAAVERWFGGQAHFEGYRARLRDRAQVLSQVFGGGEVPVDRLVAWLDDPERSIIERASAGNFLGSARGNGRALAALLRHRHDAHPLVRFYVVDGLSGHLPASATALREALADPRRVIRVRAYEALHLFDPSLETDAAFAAVRHEAEVRQQIILADDPRHVSDQALWAFTQHRLDDAERLLRRAVAIADPVPAQRTNLVRFLLENQRYDEAERELLVLEANDPAGEPTRFARALFLMHRGRFAEALPVIEALLAGGAEDAPVLRQMRDVARQRLGL